MALETFTLPCDWRRSRERIIHRTTISSFENGSEQRRSRWSKPLREWELHFLKEKTDVDTLVAFVEARKGDYGAFYWKHPKTKVTYTVRFKDPEISKEDLARWQASEFTITLREVR